MGRDMRHRDGPLESPGREANLTLRGGTANMKYVGLWRKAQCAAENWRSRKRPHTGRHLLIAEGRTLTERSRAEVTRSGMLQEGRNLDHRSIIGIEFRFGNGMVLELGDLAFGITAHTLEMMALALSKGTMSLQHPRAVAGQRTARATLVNPPVA